MITICLCLLLLAVLFGVALKITGALLKAIIWLFILLPIGLILLLIGLLCCCTLILIPVGIGLFKAATHVILPG